MCMYYVTNEIQNFAWFLNWSWKSRGIKGTFDFCDALKAIILTRNVVTVGDRVFLNCSNLEEIEYHSFLTTIGNSAFNHSD